jgi:hypothetical protein
MLAFASIFTENSILDFNQSLTTRSGGNATSQKEPRLEQAVLREFFSEKRGKGIFTFTFA